MAITYRCPDCEFQGKAGDDAKGQEICCKGCGNKFTLPAGTVPTQNGAAAASKPPSGQAGLIEAKCPSCATKGKVPAAALGKKVKCPKCSQMFTVGGGSAPAGGPGAKLSDVGATPDDDATQALPASSGPGAKLSDLDSPADDATQAIVEAGPGARLSDLDAPPDDRTQVMPDEIGLTPMKGAADQVEEVEEVADVAILVETVCTGCQHKGNVPEKFLGKKVKCPRCAQMFVVADAVKNPAAPAGAKSGGQWWSGPPGTAPGKGQPAPAVKKTGGSNVTNKPPAPPAGSNPFVFDADAPPTKPGGKPTAAMPRTAPAARDPADEPASNRKGDSSRTLMIVLLAVVGVVAVGGIVFAVAALALSPAENQHAKQPPPTEDLPHRLPHYVVAPKTEPKAKTPVVELPPPKVDPEPTPKVDPEPKPKVDPEPPPEDKGPLRDDGGSGAIKLDNLQVRMTSIWVDHVKSPQGASKNRYLLVQVQVENSDPANPVEYHSWGAAPPLAGKSSPARMSDASGKVYKRPTPAELGVKPGGQFEREVVAPGKLVTDVLIFEMPVGDVGAFRLDLPAINIGKTGTFRINLPGHMIVGTLPPKEMDKPPPPPQPNKPTKEQQAKIDAQRAKLKSRMRVERENAVRELGEMGPVAASAVTDLVAILSRDQDEVVRATAAEALGKFGPAAKGAIGTLIKALGEEFFKIKANAAEALGNIGPDARDAVPHLKKLLANKEEGVSQKAAQALNKIDGKAPPKK